MRSSLFWKLTAAFTLVILAGIGGTLLLAGRTAEVEFRRYASSSNAGRWDEMADELTDYYAAHGGWEDVEEVFSRGRGHGRGSPPMALADADSLVVAGQDAEVGQRADAEALEAGLPILLHGERVGTLLMPGGEKLTAEQEDFLARMRLALAVSGGAALGLALVLGALLVRGVTRPLRQLAAASRSVAAGNLTTRVAIRSRDEIGHLAAAFNQMTADLARAEESRRQQAADIAHELRTPLTIIQGHLEALADGVFPVDSENLAAVLEQTRLLARLVEDLRTLSLADAGQLALTVVPTTVGDWLAGLLAGFRARAAEQGVELTTEIADGLPPVEIDPLRMAQVLGNLLDNALRCTPQGGRVSLGAEVQGEEIVVWVLDTGPGVPEEHLAHLFERFWRSDPSRSRHTGGSGLGLAVARQIVEEHGGRLWAANAPQGGLRVSLSLPLTRRRGAARR